LRLSLQDVDARHKAGHDGLKRKCLIYCPHVQSGAQDEVTLRGREGLSALQGFQHSKPHGEEARSAVSIHAPQTSAQSPFMEMPGTSPA